MRLGASTKCFGGMSAVETATTFEKSGLSVCELCFCMSDLDGWRYNYCGRSNLPTASDVLRAIATFRGHGVETVAIGAYTCFWSEGDRGLSDSLSQLCEYLEIARECGIATVATHTGTLIRSPFPEKSRALMLEGFADACIEAAKRGITISVETTVHDAVDSYAGFLQLREHVKGYVGRSDMLRLTACPSTDADGIPISDIALCHLKDIKRGGKFYERPGDGDFDFTASLERLDKGGIPIILECVNSGNVGQTAEGIVSLLL